MAKSKIIEILEELSTSLIYSLPEMLEDHRSAIVNQIILILLGIIEGNNDRFTLTKISLNTNIDALWERLIQIYDFTNNSSNNYLNPNTEGFRIGKMIAAKFSKLYETKSQTKTREKEE